MRRKNLFLATSIFFVLCLTAFTSGIAGDKAAKNNIELVIALPFGPDESQSWAQTKKFWCERVTKRTEGRVTFKVHFGGELLSLPNMIEGIGSGLADIGIAFTGYSPSQFPVDTKIGGIIHPSFNLSELETVSIGRVLFEEFPAFPKQYMNMNIKKLSIIVTPGWQIVSRVPIDSLNDFNGKKIRCYGSATPKLLKSVGAVPVTMAFSEVLDGLDKRVIDGTLINTINARDMNFDAVAPHIIKLGPTGMPGYLDLTCFIMNLNTWSKLPSDIKRILMEETKTEEINYALYSKKESPAAIKDMLNRGAKLHTISANDLRKWAELCPDFSIEAERELNAQNFPGTQMMNRWKELAGMSPEQLKTLWNEAWDKKLSEVK